MNKIKIIIFFICFIASPLTAFAKYEYVNIKDPFLRKIPIAISQAAVVSEKDSGRVETASDALNIIKNALIFSNYFNITGEDVSIRNIQKTEEFKDIDFNKWVQKGAEFLIKGEVLEIDGAIILELRLFDTFTEKMLIGKKYKGSIINLRKMIYRFCGEAVFNITGSKGIFESKIAFVSTVTNNKKQNKELFICDFDGNDIKQLTDYKSISTNPAWSSNCKWLSFTSFKNGKSNIFIKKLGEDRELSVFEDNMGINSSWVPNKLDLSAALAVSGDSEIYLWKGKEDKFQKIVSGDNIDISPTWSPDGKKMAFVSKRTGSPQIYIKDMETNEITRLTFDGFYNQEPSWSPKGDKIAYTSMKDGNCEIMLISANGGEPIQLTKNSGNNESPTWSPDGNLIAFASNRFKEIYKIYVMTAKGENQRMLFYFDGEQSNPSWSPSCGEE